MPANSKNILVQILIPEIPCVNLSGKVLKMNAQLVSVGGNGGVKDPSNFVECRL